MPTKELLLIDTNGLAKKANHFEVVAQRLNSWTGWQCAIGSGSLHIDGNGNVWRGVCGVGGILGNIKNDLNFALPALDSEVTCNVQYCHCASDYYTNRIRSDERRDLLTNWKESENFDPSQIAAVRSISQHSPFRVTWDIGHRCNYKCWYCVTHDTTSPHLSIELMKSVVDKVTDHVRGTFPLTEFLLTGGEPTLHPDLLTFCRYTTELGHSVLVDSNGSRSGDYYVQLIEILGSVRFSLHLDYTKAETLVPKVAQLIEWIRNHPSGKRKYIQLKYMVQPGMLEKVFEIEQALFQIPHYLECVIREFSPLQIRTQDHALRGDYLPAEVEFLKGVTL